MPDDPNKKAFVLMPFDQEFKPIYNDLIKPALESAGYEVERADSFMDQRNILRDVVKGISEADLVIADLTAVNPNVLYELGLCHGLRVPTVLIAQSLEEVPFDLRSYRVITYSTQFDEVYKLKDALRELGERHQRKSITFESPVTDFLQVSSRSGSESSGLQERSEGRDVPQGTPSEEETGYLDWLVGINTAGEEIAKFLTDITQGVSEYTTRMTEHGEKIQAITGNPNPGMAAHAHRIALLASKDMRVFTQMILERRPSLEKQVEILTDAFPQYVNWMEPSIQEQRTELGKLREVMAVLANGTRTGIAGSTAIRESTISLRNQGISRDLNLATNSLAKALGEMISSFEKLEAFCLRVLPIIDAKLAQ